MNHDEAEARGEASDMGSWVRSIAALLAGAAVFIALFPFSGDDSDPPKYYSVFGYGVPAGIWLALAAGVVVGGLMWILLGNRSRKSKPDAGVPE
jgi:hypothetical protein